MAEETSNAGDGSPRRWVIVAVFSAPAVLWLTLLFVGIHFREWLREHDLASLFKAANLILPAMLFCAEVAFLSYKENRSGESPLAKGPAVKRALLLMAVLAGIPMAPLLTLAFRDVLGSWLYTLAGLVLTGVLSQLLWPVLIVPLLDRDEAGQRRLDQIVDRLRQGRKLPLCRVLCAKEEEDDETPDYKNAYASGWGPTRTIILEAGLLARLTDEEVGAVVAHELAHIQERHLTKRLLGVAGIFVLAGSSLRASDGESFISVVVLVATLLLALRAKTALDRWLEFEADRIASDWAGAQFMAAALVKLSSGEPPSFRSRFLGSHPSLKQRLRRLGQPLQDVDGNPSSGNLA